jgi:kynurenine 3-monooxygenase
MPTLVEDFRTNPTSPLVTIRCGPWHPPAPHAANVLLIGDAAHAIVPFYGQGMNAAFEDCRVLAELLEAGSHDVAKVLPRFYEQRKPNADAIADMALDNFIEMRDKVGSRLFLMKKKGEKLLQGLLPGVFTPLYNMISFTNTPYAQARRRATVQGRWLTLIAAVLIAIAFLIFGRVAVMEMLLGVVLLPVLAAAFFYLLFARPHHPPGASPARGQP